MKLPFFLFLNAAATLLAAPKNVLLICVDDLKPALGCYGDKQAKTPNLDKLAARGLVFDRAYCNQAVCAPSRHALMLGVRPQTLGIYDLATKFREALPQATTLGQVMIANGYRSEAMGKIFHIGQGNTDDSATWSSPHFTAKSPLYGLPSSEAKQTDADKAKPSAQQPRGLAFEGADVPDETFGDAGNATEAVSRLALAKSKPEIPFFMAVGFTRPHLPFVAPKKYWDLHNQETLPLAEFQEAPEGAPSYAPHSSGELRTYRDIPAAGPIPLELQRSLIHGYYAATSYMDAQVGRVLDALEKEGLANQTLVILWGDHGWHLGDHGIWCKHSNYEQATRIPLLVAGPGVVPGRTQSLTETVDIFPTIAAWAGLNKPETTQSLDGKSFLAVLAAPQTSHRDSVIHVYPRAGVLGRAIRNARYRLVEWKPAGATEGSVELELYDYQADPLEKQNIASTRPEIVKEMLAVLGQHPAAKPQIKTGKPPTAAPVAKFDRQQAHANRDANKDGKLSQEEFLTGQPDPQQAAKRFPLFDTDQDGFLSEKEYVMGGKR